MRLQDGKLVLSASDLSAHLGCQYRTQLDRRAATGQLEAPPPDPMLAVLQERGSAHEQAYIEYLERDRSISRVDLTDAALDLDGMAATRRAMARGVDLIVQAPLVAGSLRGVADVLLRIDRPAPTFAAWSYLVVDTKLAARTRAGTVLQLCLYTHIVGEIQGGLPEEFWVVSPGRFDRPERFRTTDYLAFARRIERELTQAVEGALRAEPAAPEPVNECDICRWWSRCDERRRGADHLAFVAGISRLQRRELGRLGIGTLTALAGARRCPSSRLPSEAPRRATSAFTTRPACNGPRSGRPPSWSSCPKRRGPATRRGDSGWHGSRNPHRETSFSTWRAMPSSRTAGGSISSAG